MAGFDYVCIESVSEYSKCIRLLLKLIEFPYYGRLHYCDHVIYQIEYGC